METELRTTLAAQPPEHRTIIRIACRYVEQRQARAAKAAAEGREPLPVPTLLDTTLALLMAHRNGCALDLERMLAADEFNLEHDVGGILTHLDRRTGKVGGLFLPRMMKVAA